MARLDGKLWHENPYGYPSDSDDLTTKAKSWSMGWLAQEREMEMAARHQRIASRESSRDSQLRVR
jgi:hypothetical protein